MARVARAGKDRRVGNRRTPPTNAHGGNVEGRFGGKRSVVNRRSIGIGRRSGIQWIGY